MWGQSRPHVLASGVEVGGKGFWRSFLSGGVTQLEDILLFSSFLGWLALSSRPVTLRGFQGQASPVTPCSEPRPPRAPPPESTRKDDEPATVCSSVRLIVLTVRVYLCHRAAPPASLSAP